MMHSIFKYVMLKCGGLLLLEFTAIIRYLWKRYTCLHHFQLVILKYTAWLNCVVWVLQRWKTALAL